MIVSDKLLADMKSVARRYYKETNVPLRLIGDIAEHEIARMYKMKLATTANNPGYDAIKNKIKYQIKASVYRPNKTVRVYFSNISVRHDFNTLLCCVYNEMYRLIGIYRFTKRKVCSLATVKKYSSLTSKGLKQHGTLIYGNGI